MSAAVAHCCMRLVSLLLPLSAVSCASPSPPPTPATDVAAASSSPSSSSSVLERAQQGLLFVDGGPEGADVVVDPHAGHHMHHGHHGAAAADAGVIVDAGTP